MKSSPSSRWSVGDVAGRFGLPTNVLRHWESVGLLFPQRDAAGRRRYGEDDVVRVAVILRSKASGMSLDQIAHLLERDMSGRHEVLQAHLDDLDRRMAEMQHSKAMTEHALRCSAHDISTCPRFRAEVIDVLDGFPAPDVEHSHGRVPANALRMS
ncbi:MerR family transcriptional regulator [Microbacterium sp.]|uniref:MerR family transcriptional regulator n=1 Tax=Microbacterium sp. TaxID=51671 RepID=UPI002810C7B7|nr:MerR family transcriptional regulator [Microbacterium sp.]